MPVRLGLGGHDEGGELAEGGALLADVVDEEDMVLSAIMTTTALSENRLYSGLN